MKIEYVSWNRTACYNFFGFAGLKSVFYRQLGKVLRGMPSLNAFDIPSHSLLCMKCQGQDNRVVLGLETICLIYVIPLLVSLLLLPSMSGEGRNTD